MQIPDDIGTPITVTNHADSYHFPLQSAKGNLLKDLYRGELRGLAMDRLKHVQSKNLPEVNQTKREKNKRPQKPWIAPPRKDAKATSAS